MTASDIKNLILQGEGVSVEFKACTEEISPAVYETVCAFLNRSGGHILLGVNDNGEIAGIREQSVESLLKNFINTVNNPEILNPTFLFAPKIIELDGKKIIDIYVPESSEVHRYKGRIFDRAGDADNDITRRHSLIDNIYLRKRKDFSESEVLPFLEIKDLDKKTLEKARKLVAFNEPNHPWKLMNDEELLHSAGFWKKDKETGKEGFILATALLFGQENTISNYCPAYKTDAIYRNTAYRRFLNPLPEDPDRRYDDRDIIYVNLIEAYDRLMNFVKRNLPDKFYLPPSGTQRIDLRDRIFREIVANLLVHREFSNRFPAKFLVFSDRVITENWTRPAGKATATLNELETYTKNPMIAKIFRELGYVEELGSGRINIQRYAPLYYSDYFVQIVNDEKFSFTIVYQNAENLNINKPNTEIQSADTLDSKISILITQAMKCADTNRTLNDENRTLNDENRTVNDENRTVKTELHNLIIVLLKNRGISRKEISALIKKGKTVTHQYLKILKDARIVEFIGADKTGGYYLTEEIKKLLS